jgi:hypothetical protein
MHGLMLRTLRTRHTIPIVKSETGSREKFLLLIKVHFSLHIAELSNRIDEFQHDA